MPFSNVPVKNPGRYFEQFVKVVQPIAGSPSYAAGVSNTPSMAVTSNFVTSGAQDTGATVANVSQSGQSFGSYGVQQVAQFK